MGTSRYTDEELRQAAATSTSFRQVLMKLGLVYPAGGSQDNLIRKCKALNIDTSHFTGQAWNKGKTFPEKKKKTLKGHLKSNHVVGTHTLRNLLLDTKTRFRKCEVCNIEEWNEKPAPLELHHIDGDRLNNLLENLQIICPNCHAQTDNHAGKGKRKDAKD